MSVVARPHRTGTQVDVDHLLQARYLDAVVQELEAMRVQVDAAVLNGPGRPGGTVVLRDEGDARDPLLPSYVRWNGGRRWTLISGGVGGGTRRRRLRRHRLPAPQEVAQFVAGSVRVHTAPEGVGDARTSR
jgi:hypothetical protein